MPNIRVLLADDHTIVRAGIRSLLEKQAGIVVLAEAADGREAMALAHIHRPDIALMDIGMPVLNGLEATVRLTRDLPSVRIIILSMHAHEEYVLQAFKAGAAGYVLKKSAIDELAAAVRTVAQGGRYLCPALGPPELKRLARNLRNPAGPLEILTRRQREILQLITERKSTKEIAFLLKLSPKTVEFHRSGLMRRLGIFDIPGLVRYALHHGVTSPEF